MKKLFVLARNKNTYFIDRLIKEVGIGQLTLHDPFSEGKPRPGEATVLVRTTGVHGNGEDLEDLAGKVINGCEALRLFRHKGKQYLFFKELGLPHLPWLDLLRAGKDDFLNFINSHQRPLIKPHRGQGGWGIRVLTREEALEWWSEATDRDFLLQPYVEKARELRLFFIQDWTVTLERRPSGGAAAANFRQAGAAKEVRSPGPLLKILRELRRHLPLHYGALDALEVEGRVYVLELNLVPGVEQLEEVTGENIIARLVHSIT